MEVDAYIQTDQSIFDEEVSQIISSVNPYDTIDQQNEIIFNHREKVNELSNKNSLLKEEITKFQEKRRIEQQILLNVINEKDKNIDELTHSVKDQKEEIENLKKQLTQKDLGNKWLKLQVEKNNLRRDINYQYAGMAAMGMGIAVTGSYLLSKCI